jgi:hypothetical protein
MELDEQVVGALPGNKRLMSELFHETTTLSRLVPRAD